MMWHHAVHTEQVRDIVPVEIREIRTRNLGTDPETLWQ